MAQPAHAVRLLLFVALSSVAAAHDFSMPGHSIVHDDEDLGIVNGRITCGVSKEFLGRVNGIWAPPLVSSDCAVRWLLNDEELKLDSFTWNPASVSGAASVGPLKVDFSAWLREDRAIVQAIRVRASGPGPHEFDLTLKASGSLDVVQRWEFARAASTTPAKDSAAPSGLVLRQGDEALAVQCHDLAPKDGALSGHFMLRDGDAVTLLAAITVGSADDAVANTELALQQARAEKDPLAPRKVDTPLALPAFSSDNPALDAFFSRSLVHLIMNRWTAPEFKLNPYYATGSVKGGCLCNYLWNFGEIWEILPLLDPAATKAHIKQFLACDLTEHFAFDPIGGEAFGPWYMVNQEKIIGLIYFYTLITGDTAFLHEKLDDKTIAELAVAHALVKDDLTRPVALIDYGPSNSHLELRREYAYNHVMPDLNGRRHDNLVRAAAIAEWGGTPRPDLGARAEALKTLLNQELWDTDAKWYRFINGKGEPELRYTIQLFKLFNSGVLGPDQVEGLLSHFNEREFFSQYGMHSMSKLDPAYDQVDIDNGGGGACTCFPPQIAERLYKAGHTAEADDILRRILWWGERMPYWGDSIVANEIAYRKDTPLQSTIDGATVAQCIIFGLFGISPRADGSIAITPRKTGLFRAATLGEITLRGHRLTVTVKDGGFSVATPESRRQAALGETITLPAL